MIQRPDDVPTEGSKKPEGIRGVEEKNRDNSGEDVSHDDTSRGYCDNRVFVCQHFSSNNPKYCELPNFITPTYF